MVYTKRKLIKGVTTSGGIVLGYARLILPGDMEVVEKAIPASKVAAETAALDHAIELTIAELRALRDSAGKKVGGPVAKIFDAQLLIAGDYEFLKQVKQSISSRRRNAGFVYNSLVRQTTEPLKMSTDLYMRQMALDVEAVASRVLSYLGGETDQSDLKLPLNTIPVARTFSPGDILTYRQRNAIGFVISEGGSNSHMALIARSLMLPVVMVGDDVIEQIPNDARIILDGTRGEIIVRPTDADWSSFQRRRKRESRVLLTRIRKVKQLPPRTKDGKEVGVGSNLTLPGVVDDLLSDHNIPIGLYRTEFLYLEHNDFPDEEAQYQYYRQIAQKFSGTTVVFRTFDLGYDKLAAGTRWPEENNPALGWRGIRVMLGMPDIFKTQIRALLRASGLKNLKVMLPMVAELSELERAKRLIAQVKFTLKKEGVPFDHDIPLGIMVEIPSAAMTADKLAQKVDFISIGSNDLTQYTLAADRMNSRVAELYSHFHPSVLNLMWMTVQACRRHGKPVSVCGEMAGDLLALPLLIGMKIDLLSMHPNRIFDVCRMAERIDSTLVPPLVSSVLSSGSLQSAIGKLQRYKNALEKKKH